MKLSFFATTELS
jgi:hypothetical protein